MVDLSLHLSPSEISIMSKVMAVMISDNKELIGSDDYLHYYNIKSLAIRFQKKILNCNYPVKKARKLKVRVNINEFNSVKFFINKFYSAQMKEQREYWQFLFQYFIGELDKQNQNIATILN